MHTNTHTKHMQGVKRAQTFAGIWGTFKVKHSVLCPYASTIIARITTIPRPAPPPPPPTSTLTHKHAHPQPKEPAAEAARAARAEKN